MRRTSAALVAAALGLLLMTPVLGAAVVETMGTRAPGQFDADRVQEEMAVLHQRLVAEQASTALSRPLAVTITAEDLEAVEAGAPGERRIRVGVVKDMDATLDLSRVSTAQLQRNRDAGVKRGAIRGLPGGGFVWTSVVRSEGAAALRVRLSEIFLPRHAELYVYGPEREVFGPYTRKSKRDFWSPTVTGDTLIVQLRYTGVDTERALRATRLSITQVGHITEKFLFAVLQNPHGLQTRGFCSFNESCVVNADCAQPPSDLSNVPDAIAHIQFVSGAYIYICTGGLLTDTASSRTPYFLTANHCVSKKGEASSLDAFFQFVTPCNGACYDPESSPVPRTHGATILKSSRTSDYTLMLLAQPAPPGSFFLGWTSADVAYANGTQLFRFSHPGGAPQAYSEHEVDTSKGVCRSWPRGGWIYSDDTFGATEGGSSGSPVVNAAGQVVGQLSGACGTNVNDPCDSSNNATVDGAFANYYPSVSQWLGSDTGCTDGDNDGFCVDEDCDDDNPNVNPGAVENCFDSVDNDCDGYADDADPDCSGGCELGDPGDPCTDDAQCCSNKCKGKPGAQTCR